MNLCASMDTCECIERVLMPTYTRLKAFMSARHSASPSTCVASQVTARITAHTVPNSGSRAQGPTADLHTHAHSPTRTRGDRKRSRKSEARRDAEPAKGNSGSGRGGARGTKTDSEGDSHWSDDTAEDTVKRQRNSSYSLRNRKRTVPSTRHTHTTLPSAHVEGEGKFSFFFSPAHETQSTLVRTFSPQVGRCT